MICVGVTIAYTITMRVVVWWRWMKAGVARVKSDARQRRASPEAKVDIVAVIRS
jgi:hypothetical protein